MSNITKNDEGEFRGGIWFHRNFQGKGFGTETFIARAQFAFQYLNAKELHNGFHEDNEKSKKHAIKTWL